MSDDANLFHSLSASNQEAMDPRDDSARNARQLVENTFRFTANDCKGNHAGLIKSVTFLFLSRRSPTFCSAFYYFELIYRGYGSYFARFSHIINPTPFRQAIPSKEIQPKGAPGNMHHLWLVYSRKSDTGRDRVEFARLLEVFSFCR